MTTIKDLDINSSKYKIVVYINGECFTCAQDMIKWAKIADSFMTTNNSVSILYYLYTHDPETYKHYLQKFNVKNPVAIDTDNTFKIKNDIPEEKMLQAMLLDKRNRVVLIGNPILNENIKKLYIDTIIKDTLP